MQSSQPNPSLAPAPRLPPPASRIPPVALFALLLLSALSLSAQPVPTPVSSRNAPVGPLGTNRFLTPANQVLTPTGLQVELPGLRPQALALSPNGRLLVTSGKTPELIVLDPRTGHLLQRVPLPSELEHQPAPRPVSPHILEPDTAGQLSYTGLAFSPDGSRIYLANVDGSIKVFSVGKKGHVAGLCSFSLPLANASDRKADIPAGLAVSRDGKCLYVVLNLSNRLAELDTATGKVLRLWDVGVAPYDVVLARSKAYVSNWGGPRPDTNSLTGPAGQGTRVRVDPVRFIANDGSLSIIALAASALPNPPSAARNAPSAIRHPQSELRTGLRPSALALSPNRRFLVIANSGCDSLSVLDTRTDSLVETLCARQHPADLFGAQPNAVAFDRSGKHLFVCNATQNAVASFEFRPGKSRLLGLVPVGWFPAAIVHDPRRDSLYVANLKGVGSTRGFGEHQGKGDNTHEHHGTLSLLKVPSKRELPALTRTALENLRYPLLEQAALRPRPGQPPRPVPERVGEPCVFKHVVYVIKENRSYDQVLGDMTEGNGDPALCVFGERITPNQHHLARQFVLLDNTYCCGVLSADGHQWTDTAIATDYLERSFADFPRSYPDGMEDSDTDALAYSPAGFIWDNALAYGKTLRDYGEFAITQAAWTDHARKPAPEFADFFREFRDPAGALEIHSRPAIESLRPYLATNTVGWDLRIPDVFRAAQFIQELQQFEATGTFPNLILICLPNDHTSGTSTNFPAPEAAVADNDLALGRIVEALSRSKFWPQTCLFCIEDDPQDGWDHLSGFRTTAFVASPYTRRHTTVSTHYNQTSLLRTIELMLGLPPMNQFDATATPMSDCFTNQPDLTPFTARHTNIPLDRLNPEPKQLSDPILRQDAYTSARLPLAQPDRCPEDTLNHILWHALKGPNTPYPASTVQLDRDEHPATP